MTALNGRLQVRRDTAANWTSEDPVLAEGEIGYETDTDQFKIGDGSSTWSAIADYYVAGAGGGGGASSLDDLSDATVSSAADGDILRHNGTAFVNTPGTTHYIAVGDIGSVVQAHSAVLDATTASFTTADETKLDAIEAGATGDQTGAEIKAAYEAEANTNAYTDADATTVGHITVTQAVDLDQLEADVAALANGMVYAGSWDASAGSFPSGANTGAFYTVSVAGTVDSVDFAVDDRLVAITDGASTSTYAANWTKLDATDAVTSVAGQVGNVTAAQLVTQIDAESNTNFLTDAERTKLAGIEALADVTDATNVAAAGATMDADTDVSGNSWVLDEDDMSSDDATKVPTQQSVKAYVDANAATTFENNYLPAGIDTEASAYLTTPDAAPLDITGDIEIQIKAAMPDWTPAAGAAIAAKRSAGAGLHWQISVTTAGDLSVGIRTGSTDRFGDSTGANPGWVDGATYWIRIRRVASTGAVTMHYAADSVDPPEPASAAWLPITVSGTQTSGNLDTNAAPLEFGTERAAQVNVIDAILYRLIVKDGIDGTDVADFNGASTVTPIRDRTGRVWSLAGSGGVWSQ